MVKSISSVSHRGLSDWYFQRVAAVIMLAYIVILVGFFASHPQVDFLDWHMLYAQTWMKVLTILVVLCLLVHTWVGMWTVYTDYIKIFSISLIVHLTTFFALLAYFFWTLQILWGI